MVAVELEHETRARFYNLLNNVAQDDLPSPSGTTVAPPDKDDMDDLFGDNVSAGDLKKMMEKTKQTMKAAKPAVVAKSAVTLRVMPYAEGIDVTELYESDIKSIEIDGLVWGASFSVISGPFGLKGIQFGCVIEDEKVKVDDVEEAVETIGLSEEDRAEYICLRRNGDLEDYEEEWKGKKFGTVTIASFQKV